MYGIINILWREKPIFWSKFVLYGSAWIGIDRWCTCEVRCLCYLSFSIYLVEFIEFQGSYRKFFDCMSKTLISRVWSQEMAITCNFTIGNWCPLVKWKYVGLILILQRLRIGKSHYPLQIWCPGLNMIIYNLALQCIVWKNNKKRKIVGQIF